jgi:EAL domain-containing protein (putative c-di-GMP-specific phosphodiesterase class I)
VRRLRTAIERGELVLHYQPKADMRSGAIVGVEALARWQTPRRGLLGPASFMESAERSGATIGALTDWTLDEAARQAAEWRDAGHELTVAVNISPRSLTDESLPERVAGVLDRCDLSPALMQLELTETAVFALNDPDAVTEMLGALADMGIQIALDDFGTGYSSLARLRDLPIQKVKIDKSFVMKMDELPQDALIVRSVIALAKNLGLVVVAEGVEREPVWHRLADLGCDLAQGNYLTPPVPAEELIAWVRQWEELYAEAHRMATELLERREGPTDRRSGLPDRREDKAVERRFVDSSHNGSNGAVSPSAAKP